jgi:protein SCO1/2
MQLNNRIVLIGVVALLAGVYLQLFGFNAPLKYTTSKPPDIEGFFWPEQKALADFELVGHDSKPFRRSDLAEKWNFLFFGYTHCPDICPVTMNILRQVRDIVSTSKKIDPALVNFIFISVDGERDTPVKVKEYVNYFGQNFAGATGNKAQVDSLTTQLGIPYSIDEHQPGDTTYLVGHSGAILLISPQQTLSSIFQMPFTADQIASRFTQIYTFMASQS